MEDYIAGVREPARSTLQELRRIIRAEVPEATEAISYGMPTFKHRGKPLLGLAAATDHCALHFMGYLPDELAKELEKLDTTKGAIRFPVDAPPPRALVRKMIEAKRSRIDSGTREQGRGRP